MTRVCLHSCWTGRRPCLRLLQPPRGVVTVKASSKLRQSSRFTAAFNSSFGRFRRGGQKGRFRVGPRLTPETSVIDRATVKSRDKSFGLLCGKLPES